MEHQIKDEQNNINYVYYITLKYSSYVQTDFDSLKELLYFLCSYSCIQSPRKCLVA